MTVSPSLARTLILPRQAASPRGFVPASIPLRWPDKQPTARLDYSVDLATWIGSDDALAAAAAAVTPSLPGGLTAEDTAIAGTIVTVWLDLGVAAVDYVVTLTIASEGGRVFVLPVFILLK